MHIKNVKGRGMEKGVSEQKTYSANREERKTGRMMDPKPWIFKMHKLFKYGSNELCILYVLRMGAAE